MPAFYRATIQEFLLDDPDRVLGIIHKLSSENGFSELKESQSKAWQEQIELLRTIAGKLMERFENARTWGILFEYPIPRRQKRVDVIILAEDVILCMEFKTGEVKHKRSASRQVEDYALDLRDFHELSRGYPIIPIAISTKAKPSTAELPLPIDDDVKPVVQACSEDLTERVAWCVEHYAQGLVQIDPSAWDDSIYRPVPTIIEAAEALFAGHDVHEIARSHADAQNLGETSERLVSIITEAKRKGAKVLCIVTGVPGAGKTLAGLNVVHDPIVRGLTNGAGVFLSGNGPLVKIVSAALARDSKRRRRVGGAERIEGISKKLSA